MSLQFQPRGSSITLLRKMAYPGPTKTVPRIQIVERKRKIDDEKKRGETTFSKRMALPAPHNLNAALSLSERLELANRTYHVGLCYGFQWAIVEGLRCF